MNKGLGKRVNKRLREREREYGREVFLGPLKDSKDN